MMQNSVFTKAKLPTVSSIAMLYVISQFLYILVSSCNVVKYWIALLAGTCLIKDVHILDALKIFPLVHIQLHHDIFEVRRRHVAAYLLPPYHRTNVRRRKE